MQCLNFKYNNPFPFGKILGKWVGEGELGYQVLQNVFCKINKVEILSYCQPLFTWFLMCTSFKSCSLNIEVGKKNLYPITPMAVNRFWKRIRVRTEGLTTLVAHVLLCRPTYEKKLIRNMIKCFLVMIYRWHLDCTNLEDKSLNKMIFF